MERIPTETFHDFQSGTGTEIPPTEIAQIKARLAALEAADLAQTSTIAQLSTRIDLLEQEVYRKEIVFKAPTAPAFIEGGIWRVAGLYRFFESLELLTTRGYSWNWPEGSMWQIVAIRASGMREVQTISQFTFDMAPTFTSPIFELGDILGILVRNFEASDESTLYDEDNPTMCSMIFRKMQI